MSVSQESASASLPTADQSIGSFIEQQNLHTASPPDPQKDIHESGSSDAAEEYPQCKLCGKYFVSRLYLQQHSMLPCVPAVATGKLFINELKTRPKKPKEYRCEECNLTFETSRQLRRHLDIHNVQEESSKCSYCDKVFFSLLKLKRHESYHKAVRHYKCSYCEKSFRSPSQLQNHERYHTGERPYKCDQCDKSFVTVTYFRYHQQTHNPERPCKCVHCDKAFIIPSQLKVHLRKHTGERPYKCIHCDKGFPSRSQLESHKRHHTGLTAYRKLQYKSANAMNHNTDQ